MTQATALTLGYDNEAANAFAERIGETINGSAITLMLSIGHRTGLFDTLARLPASTSHEIADASGLAERYVREWLAVMVVGRVVNYDPARQAYELPPEHAACLTRDAPLGNLAIYAQFIPMAGTVQEPILACFETGDGTRYDAYPCFHRIMAEDSAQNVVSQVFDTLLPLAEEMPGRLENGIDVLDAGCGAGRTLVALAERYPNSRFTGYDLCADAIDLANRSAKAAGLSNLSFSVRDLTGFDEPNSYDLVTSFDAIHDQKDPQGLLTGIYRALRLDGVHLMQDIGGSAKVENNLDFPFAAFLYAMSCMHCMPVSLGQGGAGLGTMWGWETADSMLRTAGFGAPERTILPHDPMNVWFVSRKK